ncbi:hypothetical protein [Actinotalea sp. C106]|uniref:hypothetical protein n=1 Tax=Actinotalea sp. C106 TaxID=2908644 RepID=UPI002028AB17|nr:hypothetical protein [Actinotalea sp. C106]
MAAQAFGLLVSVDEGAARYDVGVTEDGPERGIVIIPMADPEAWRMEGREDRPHFAATIVGRALHLRSTTGEWPENASYQS